MNFLISFCLNNRITVILLTIALAIISIFVVKNIPVDVFPELKVPRVTIQTEAPGLTAEEVEQYITIPIESAMNGTAGVKGVRSSSGSGLSFVWVDFDWNKDIYQARQIVTERLGAVRESLPEGTSPELAPIVSITGEIMLIALTGDKDTSQLDMRQLAEYKLRTRQSHALEDFKRFHKSKNYRRIFDNQHEFAVLVKDDPELQKQFVEDLGKMAVIERALGAARQREAMQDVYGAWEELQQLRSKDQELFINDQELNARYLDLTTKASTLVNLLNDAEKCRNEGEVGSALGKYMEAKRLYLYSRFAKEGIESLLDEIFR